MDSFIPDKKDSFVADSFVPDVKDSFVPDKQPLQRVKVNMSEILPESLSAPTEYRGVSGEGKPQPAGEEWLGETGKKLLDAAKKLDYATTFSGTPQGLMKAASGISDVLSPITTPVENIAPLLVNRARTGEVQNPAELLRMKEENRPSTGNPKEDVALRIMAGMSPVGMAGMDVVGGIAATKLVRMAEKAAAARKVAQHFAELDKGLVELPKAEQAVEETARLPEATKAVVGAQQELGPTASTIPDRIFEPTSPEVKAGRELGVQSRLIPSHIWEGAQKPAAEATTVTPDVVHDAVSGVNLSDDPGGLKTMFRDLSVYLGQNGAEGIVAPIKQAARKKDEWLHKYMSSFAQIMEGSGIKQGTQEATDIADLLNGVELDHPLSAKVYQTAMQIRDHIFDPAINEVRANPELEKIIGPTGYLSDYWPNMRKILERYNFDKETIMNMFHDLYPERFKSRFLKERSVVEGEINKDPFVVIPAYLKGVAKTLFDVPAYNQVVRTKMDWTSPVGQLAKEFADSYIGQARTREPVDAIAKGKGKIGKWIYDAYIGFNPLSAVANRSQQVNTVIAVGPKYWLQGRVLARQPEMQKMFVSTGAMRDYPGLEKLTQAGEMGDLGKSKLDKAAYFLFNKAEWRNRLEAFCAGFAKARAEGKSIEEAKSFGLDTVSGDIMGKSPGTQFSYGKESPVLYTQKNPLVGKFSNYPIKQLEFMRSIIRNREQDPAAYRRLLATMATSFLAPGAVGAAANPDEPVQGALDAYNKLANLGLDFLPVPGLGPLPRAVMDAQRMAYQAGQGNPPTAGTAANLVLSNTPYIGGPYRMIKRLLAALAD